MRAILIVALMTAGCGRPAPTTTDPLPNKLEEAAIARGLITNPAKAGLTGSWASDTDRLCVVPEGGALRLGAGVDYGDGQTCAASGSAERRGDTLRVQFGACRFEASFDGERIVFPADLPPACDRFCIGRASLSALAVERLSESASEAASLRGAGGQALCSGAAR